MSKTLKTLGLTLAMAVVFVILVGAGCQGLGDFLSPPAAPTDSAPGDLLPATLSGASLGEVAEDEFEGVQLAIGEYGDFRVYVLKLPNPASALNTVGVGITETEECSSCSRSFVNDGEKAYLNYNGETLLDVSGEAKETEHFLMWNNGPFVFTIENLGSDPELVDKVASEFPY